MIGCRLCPTMNQPTNLNGKSIRSTVVSVDLEVPPLVIPSEFFHLNCFLMFLCGDGISGFACHPYLTCHSGRRLEKPVLFVALNLKTKDRFQSAFIEKSYFVHHHCPIHLSNSSSKMVSSSKMIREPLKPTGCLNNYDSVFRQKIHQFSIRDRLGAPNSDELIREFAIIISTRRVVFLRDQRTHFKVYKNKRRSPKN